MDRMNFRQVGGFPITENILGAMQDAWSVLNSLGNLAGDFAIIAGCTLSGSTVSDGMVAINGEILPFRGGIVMDTVIVAEEDINYNFQDGSNKTIITKRYARFGNSGNAFNWADFKNIFPTTLIQQFKDDFEARIKALENAKFPIPIGMIAIWNKPNSVAIPTGWKECTDLRGRIPLGWDPNDADFATIGGNLGEKAHTLSQAELPSAKLKTMRNTKVPGYGINGSTAAVMVDSGGSQNYFITGTNAAADVFDTSPMGSDQPHNNIQPSHIVRFIEYTGN